MKQEMRNLFLRRKGGIYSLHHFLEYVQSVDSDNLCMHSQQVVEIFYLPTFIIISFQICDIYKELLIF